MSSLARDGDQHWQRHAACVGEVAVNFYPPVRTEKKVVRLARESRAKAVCAGCRVRLDCLEQALANNERYGIWGGLTDVERRAHLEATGRADAGRR